MLLRFLNITFFVLLLSACGTTVVENNLSEVVENAPHKTSPSAEILDTLHKKDTFSAHAVGEENAAKAPIYGTNEEEYTDSLYNLATLTSHLHVAYVFLEKDFLKGRLTKNFEKAQSFLGRAHSSYKKQEKELSAETKSLYQKIDKGLSKVIDIVTTDISSSATREKNQNFLFALDKEIRKLDPSDFLE